MENKEIILFIIIIINIYLLYKMNKKESFTNSNESITITESIKNLGTIAAEIQKDGNYKFPGNIIIPHDSKIIFEGPDNSGKSSEIFFNKNANGLEIAQSNGADNLRLNQNGNGFDFKTSEIKRVSGSDPFKINGDIHATGHIYADISIAGITGLRLNSTTIGPEHLKVLTGEKDFYIKNTYNGNKYLKYIGMREIQGGAQWDEGKNFQGETKERSKTRIEL